jgi:predicted hydrolase (HD superfamily)
MDVAICVWHHDVVDREKAMTELLEAVADASNEARAQRTLRLAAALYEADKLAGVQQKDLVRATGLTRETIRRHIEDEKIRRGEIDPTPRYLAEQERAEKRRAAREF